MNFLKKLFQRKSSKTNKPLTHEPLTYKPLKTFDFGEVFMQAKFDAFVRRQSASELPEAIEWFFNQPEQQCEAAQQLKQKVMK